MDFILALTVQNKILKNDSFKKNVQKTGAPGIQPADCFVCSLHHSNFNYSGMMTIGLILLCAGMFWLLYKSVEFFDQI